MLHQRNLIGIVIGLLFIAACRKEKMPTNLSDAPPGGSNTTPISIPCVTRATVNASLVSIGFLSSARYQVLTAFAGNKILFVGGWHSGQNWWNEPVPVDIYDISNNKWSTYSLVPDNPQFTHFRFGAAIASVGTKILFAGGGDGMGDNQSSKVDIYDASTNSWSSAQLSTERQGLAAATVGDKVLFAGGFGYPGYFSTVDIYDDHNHSWSTASLSQPREDITATTAGNKIYFAGGRIGSDVSKTIDIYDLSTNSWSVSSLQQARTGMASIEANGKLFWGGGAKDLGTTWGYNDNVEILDLGAGVTSFECMIPRTGFTAIKKGDNIVFFTGSNGGPGDHFEIYNTVSGTWSTGVLNQKIQGAAIISVNNTIYVAGGMVDGNYSNQVWKLQF